MTIDSVRPENVLVRVLYIQAPRARKVNDIVEDHGNNQFANGQSSRDLRAGSDASELKTQLVEAIDNVADFLRFVEISTRVNAIKQRRSP